MNVNIARELLNKRIEEIRIMSFSIDSQKVCDQIAVFFLFEEAWFKVTVSDGLSIIERQDEEPRLTENSQAIDLYAFPVSIYECPDYLATITEIKEYLWHGLPTESIGLFFVLNNGSSFSLVEDNDCIAFVKGQSILLDGYELKEVAH